MNFTWANLTISAIQYQSIFFLHMRELMFIPQVCLMDEFNKISVRYPIFYLDLQILILTFIAAKEIFYIKIR